MEWVYKIEFYITVCLQDDGMIKVESIDNIGVFREHINSDGGQVSEVSPNVSVAPS